VLEQTVNDLASRFPNVLTIGVVPVGLTRTPQEILAGPDPSCSRILPSAADLPLRTFLPEEARRVVRQVRRWQQDFRQRNHCGLVYASDEFYLLCSEPVPSAASYDGYPQYENGIGMVRDLLDDWKRLRKRLASNRHKTSGVRSETPSASLVCAEMIAEVLAPLVDEWSDLTRTAAALAVIPNTFFGPRVRVSGLLTGQDIISNKERFTGDVVILPSVMLDKTGSRLLDGVTPAQLRAAIGKPIYFAGYLSEVHRLLTTTQPSSISA
jgi:NifB/MoaA-like Fe-S oxidoreductase